MACHGCERMYRFMSVSVVSRLTLDHFRSGSCADTDRYEPHAFKIGGSLKPRDRYQTKHPLPQPPMSVPHEGVDASYISRQHVQRGMTGLPSDGHQVRARLRSFCYKSGAQAVSAHRAI